MLAALLGAAGCAQVPALTEDGCGNLVINDDEDCDGFSRFGGDTACGDPGEVHACRYVCDAAGDTECPPGWGCGSDGLCRRPLGTFDSAGEDISFKPPSFELGDLDGDGVLDLVGNLGSTLSLRFGDGNGQFSAELDVLIPQPTGPLTYGRLDGDERLDVLVPIIGGVFPLLGSDSRTVDPVAYPALPVAETGRLRLLPLRAHEDVLGPPELTEELLLLSDAGMLFLGPPAPVLPYPGGHILDDLGEDIAVGNVDRDAGGVKELALAVEGTRDVYLCGAVASPDGLGLDCSFQVVRTTDRVSTRGTQFADVNGDGRLDLLVAVEGLAGVHVEIALNLGGALDSGAVFEAQSMRRMPLGTWPLAVGDFDRDGVADYVYSRSIVWARPDGALPALPRELVPVVSSGAESWVEATVVDINGDGWLDVATSVEGRDGVDIYINATGAAGVLLFNKFHIDTSSPPLVIRAGDFDGDLVDDIALSEFELGVPQTLSVIFGSRSEGPSQAVTMASFDQVEVLEPVVAAFSLSGGPDFIADLMVLTRSDEGDRTLSLLQGDSSRRMLAPLILTPAVEDMPWTRVALLGQFDGSFTDVVAIAGQPPMTGTEAEPRVWLVRGTDDQGGLTTDGSPGVPLSADYPFDARCALWAVGDMDGDLVDEVVGIDNNAPCPGAGGPQDSNIVVASVVQGGIVDGEPVAASLGLAVPRSLTLHDLDVDGDLDVLAVFAGAALGGGQSGVAVLWNDGGALDLANPARVILPGDIKVFDAAPIHASDDLVPELLILAAGGGYIARLDGRVYGEPSFVFRQEGDGFVRVGDVDRDGLDDVVFLVAPSARVLVQAAGPPLGATPESIPGGEQ